MIVARFLGEKPTKALIKVMVNRDIFESFALENIPFNRSRKESKKERLLYGWCDYERNEVALKITPTTEEPKEKKADIQFWCRIYFYYSDTI